MKSRNYEFATLPLIISVTGHEAILLIGEYACKTTMLNG